MESSKWNVDTSPFEEYIETNSSPSDGDLNAIQIFLKEPHQVLDDLDQQIGTIQTKLAALLEKRTRIATFIDKHLAITSLVRRLPDEVLSSIFVACLPEIITFVRTDAPLLVTWVSHRWREVALATPALWSTLHIAFPLAEGLSLPVMLPAPPPQRIIDLRCSAFVEWMHRAKGQTLSLSVRENVFLGVQVHPDSKILGTPGEILLDSISHRIRSLTISESPKTFGISGARFPALQRLAIPFGMIDMTLEDSILCAPGLEEVRLEQIRGISITQLPLRWAQLTRLSFSVGSTPSTRFTNQVLLDLVDSCKMLQWLDVRVVGTFTHGSPHPLQPRRTVHSPNLRCLLLSDAPDVSGDVFQSLSLPALSELSTTLVQVLDLSQYALSLRRLSIVARWCSPQEFITLLSGLPYLESLTIGRPEGWRWIDSETYGFTDKVLTALTPHSSSDLQYNPGERGTLCPLLTSLEVGDFEYLGISIEALISFVNGKNGKYGTPSPSPTRSAAKLKHLKLMPDDFRDHEVQRKLETLEQYVNDGLELEIPQVRQFSLLAGAHDALALWSRP